MASNVTGEITDLKGEEDESQQDTEVKSKISELHPNPVSSTLAVDAADTDVPLPVIIHQNGSTAIVSYRAREGINLITLRIWLQAVNKQINKSSVDIMKLGLLGDKRQVPYEVLSRAEKPSDIFNSLEEHLGSKKAAVQRFIFALKRLGHRRNGYVCVRKYKEKVGEDPPPKFEVRNESESFGLCQCLVDICVKIKEDVSRALIRYCGRFLLSKTPENISSLACMFTEMCQSMLITPQNQEKLAIALAIVNANECIDCIQKYCLKYNLPEIVIEEHKVKQVYAEVLAELEHDDTSSSDSSSTRSSQTNVNIGSRTPSPSYFPSVHGENLTSSWTGPQPPPQRRPNRTTSEATQTDGENITALGEQQQQQPQQPDERDPLIQPNNQQNHDNQAGPPQEQHVSTMLVCCSKVILTLALTLLLLGGGIAMITVGALSGMPHEKNILTYENTSAVVTSFPTLNTKDVILRSDADVDIGTQYYQADSCSNLPSVTTYNMINGTLSLPPKLILYFLEGSVLSYNICSAAADKEVSDAHVIDFYVLNNLKELSGTPPPPYESPSVHHHIKIGYNASVANQSEPGPGWVCSKESELTFSVLKQSYYAVVVLPPSISDNAEVKYWYQSNVIHKGIRVSSLSHCANSSLSACTLHVQKHLPLEEHCIIAHTRVDNQQADDPYVRIRVTFKIWNGLVLFICLGVLLILASLIPCIVLCRRPLLNKIATFPSDIM